MFNGKFFRLSLCFVSAIICLGILVSFLPEQTVSAADDTVTIIAASDFQPKDDDYAAATAKIKTILSKMNADGIKSADAFFGLGDYSQTYSNVAATSSGIETLKSAVSGMVSKNMLFVQGNHDSAYTNSASLLSKSGNNDASSYGAYIIHEDDYMWNNTDETVIKKTAEKLKTYLDKKASENYTKPIFILSHLPLHYSSRTYKHGDAKFSSHIFNVINDAGKKGLNIVYLFGHDHSSGYDEYIGGGAICLASGDNILIAKGRESEYESKKLSFTYINAGYIGYFSKVNKQADDALSLTVFKISGNSLIAMRYSENGKHNLKSEGVPNSFENENKIPADQKVYTSPKVLVSPSTQKSYSASGSLTLAEGKSMTVKTDGEPWAFLGVKVGLSVLQASDYTVSGNPVEVTLSRSYLSSLTPNKNHKLTVMFADGNATAQIKVTAEAQPETEAETEAPAESEQSPVSSNPISNPQVTSEVQSTETNAGISSETESGTDVKEVVQKSGDYTLIFIIVGIFLVLSIAGVTTAIIIITKKK